VWEVVQPTVVSGVGPSSMQNLMQRVAQVYQLVDPSTVLSCPAGGARDLTRTLPRAAP